MSDKKYFRAFLKEKHGQYVKTRRISRRFMKYNDLGYQFECLVEDSKRFETICRTIGNRGDAEDVFKYKFLKRSAESIDHHYSYYCEILKETGYLDLLDDHFEEIAENITFEMLPKEDLEILRTLGSNDPERSAQSAIFELRSRAKKMRESRNELGVRNTLKHGQERIETMCNQYREWEPGSEIKDRMEKEGQLPPDTPKPKRKWWKGCGQIAQGSALSIGNIALATGVLELPVPDHVRTWGAIVSVTTGVGMVMSGVGDLRGE